MTPEVRTKIEQIRNGNVPEGYKKGKIGIVPVEWDEVPFSTLFASTSEYTDDLEQYPLYSLTIEDGITAKTERYERSHLVKKENSYKVVRPNDYAYNPMNIRFGAVARHKGDIPVAVSGYYDIFTTIHESDRAFMDSFLTCGPMITYYNKVSTGSLIEKQRVHFSDFMEFSLALPSIEERKKIAEILTAQDRIIELKEKLLAEKQRQKKHLMQQLLTGKKRLPGFDGEWLSVAIGRFIHELDERTTCNNQHEILSVTKNGIVRQYDHFNKQIASEDNTGYKILRRNNLAFSTMNLWMGSVDVLENYEIGIISPAYKVFSFDSKMMDTGFGKQFMRSEFMIWLYKSNSEQGASVVRRNLDLKALLSAKVKIPALKEQLAIATVLRAADKEIDLLRQDIEQEKQKKKALMQLLLTGIVRVKGE